MRTWKWAGVAFMLAGGAVSGLGTARADVASDQAAAIVIFPSIEVRGAEDDTVIQISNTSTDPQILHCFYVDADSHCSGNGRVCDSVNSPFATACSATEGLCLQGWVETDFDIFITPRQPLAWLASEGISNDDIPLDGVAFVGPNGASNAGTRVPPVAEVPFQGELKCIVVNGTGQAVPNNVIKGEATVVHPDPLAVEKYNGIGIQAINGDANGDNILVLGGDANEYNGCANVLIMDFLFDFGVNPADDSDTISSLVLVPCTEDFLNQIPGGTPVQFLVFNEFEQRFSTSTPIQCFFERQLSLIDTRESSRSIFSVFVSGTLEGQARIRGVTQGVLGILRMSADEDASFTDFNLHMQGDRTLPDQIVLP